MAQRRLRDYQDPLGSYEHNLKNLGVHYPGRFAGFDTIIATGGLTFKITHVGKGISTLDELGNPIGPLGIAMTNQGVIVMEDQEITALAVAANPGTVDRYDLLVMDHQYTLTPGGLPATYLIVPGVQGTETRGVLTPTQCILGTIRVPAGATNSTQVLYIKSPSQDSGDMADAKLEAPNAFQRVNENKQSTLPVTDNTNMLVTDMKDIGGVNFGNKWTLSYLGNSQTIFTSINRDMDLLRILGASNQDGSEINLICTEKVRLKHKTPPSPAEIAAGYSNILLPDAWRSAANDYQPTGTGLTVIYHFLRYQGSWILQGVAIISAAAQGTQPPGVSPSSIAYNFNTWKAGNSLSIIVNNQTIVITDPGTAGNKSGSIAVNPGDTVLIVLNATNINGSSVSMTTRDITLGTTLDNQTGPIPIPLGKFTYQFIVANGDSYQITGTVTP